MIKLIIFFLVGSIFSQSNISIKEVKIFKTNEMNQFDFSHIINNNDGEFLLTFINIEDVIFNKIRKNVYEKCPLKFSFTSSNNYEHMFINLCDSLYEYPKVDFYLNKNNTIIDINSEKYDLLTGTFVFWIYGNFTKDIKTGDINDIYNGILREWNDDGNLYIEYKYKNEKKHGHQKRWYPNGQLEILYNFQKGELSGEQKNWHDNGKTKSLIFYKNDVLHGIYKKWNRQGELILSKTYINGTLNKLIIDKS